MDGYLTAEISAAALAANVATLRRLLEPGCELWPVVKADAYGHGLEPVLGVLGGRVDGLAVATLSEAQEARRLGYAGPLLAFFSPSGWIDARERGDALDRLAAGGRITFTITGSQDLELLAAVAARGGSRVEAHVKVDTGMGRSGVWFEAAAELIRAARATTGVSLAGAYTHFATADEPDRSFAGVQLRRFLDVVESAGGRHGLVLHAANSAALLDLPESRLDRVRPGIAVFGIHPSSAVENRQPLRPALRLRARLMQIKTLPAGTGCSYGLEHVFARATRVGLVPVGYGDGYLFALGNRATVRAAGVDLPVRGRVTMDQIVVELTAAPELQVGDEVEIVSDEPGAPHSAEGLAERAGTIPYEILCRLGRRVRRVVV